MNEISLKMFSIGGVEGLPFYALSIGTFILLSVLLLLKWLAFIRKPDPTFLKSDEIGSSSDKLFFPIGYAYAGDKTKLKRGYLRSLTLNRATMVSSDKRLQKGALVDVDLGRIPAPKGRPCFVKGKIVRCKSLGGLPESWQVDIKLLERAPDGFSSVCRDIYSANNQEH